MAKPYEKYSDLLLLRRALAAASESELCTIQMRMSGFRITILILM